MKKSIACVLLTLVLALTLWMFYSPTETSAQAPGGTTCSVPRDFGQFRGGAMISINNMQQPALAFEDGNGVVRFVRPGNCALAHTVTRQ